MNYAICIVLNGQIYDELGNYLHNVCNVCYVYPICQYTGLSIKYCLSMI